MNGYPGNRVLDRTKHSLGNADLQKLEFNQAEEAFVYRASAASQQHHDNPYFNKDMETGLEESNLTETLSNKSKIFSDLQLGQY